MNVKDKVVIVTGASSGIGLATAKLLVKHGLRVALAARSREKIWKLAKEFPRSFAVPTDMTNEIQIRKMVKDVLNHYGRIDILINNAGQGYDASIEEIDMDKFRKVFELDVVGPLVAMQAVIPVMQKQGKGVIVNISSGTSLMGLPNMSAYSSAKRALNGITLTAREELKKDNIIVSVVYPYVTITDFEKNTIKNKSEEQNGEDFYEGLPHPPDNPEYIAEKILEGIKNGKAEIFAHDWMKNLPE